jgi:integrase
MDDKKEIRARLAELTQMMGEETEVKPTIEQLWNEWFLGMSQTKSQGTISSIKSSWKNLRPYLNQMHLDQINNIWWTTVLIPGIRRDRHNEFKFANARKWLSMLMKHCEENQKAPRGWRRPRLTDPDPETEQGRVYSIEETDRLEANADWLLLPKLVMGCPHFMRRSEIALLAWDRIDRKNQFINLKAQDTKIRKPREIPYNDRLEGLFKILEQRHAEMGIVSPYVFPSPINPQKSIGRDGFASSWATCKRAACVVGKFHWLRKSAITRAINAPGSNIMLICKVAGLDPKMAYSTYFIPDMEELRRVTK